MTHLLISDLHLEEHQPDITTLFLRFLKEEVPHAKALYILGDLFEVWVGDDDLTLFNLMIIDALQQVTTRGIPIYLMHGNRDFLIGKRFLKATGCQLLPDEYVLDCYGVPTLLMHGDTLCTRDIAYLKFRKKIRHPIIRQFILWKSLKTRKAKAEEYRAKSKAYTRTAPEHIMDVTEEEVERLCRLHHVTHLIHGHTHRQDIHHFKLDQQSATRTVLGAWHDHGNALVCEPDGTQRFIEIK